MASVYLETSALLRILFHEEGAVEAQRQVAGAEHVFASRLVKIEAERALLRLVLDRPELEKSIPDLERDLRGFWPIVHFFEITPEVCDLAGRISPASRLRTLDAVHLATYRRARHLDPGIAMLSFDERLLAEV